MLCSCCLLIYYLCYFDERLCPIACVTSMKAHFSPSPSLLLIGLAFDLNARWSQRGGRDDLLHDREVLIFLHISFSIVVVLWNCTVQRRYWACTNKRLFLIHLVQLYISKFVCVLDLGDVFVMVSLRLQFMQNRSKLGTIKHVKLKC